MDRERSRSDGRKSSIQRDRRAVSEVLSYSLIFGLIVASIAVVSVGGMNGLENVRTNEKLSNAERAFDVLHDNLRAVHSEGTPSRATEVSLGDSQIFFGDNITVTVDLNSGTVTREIRPIIFRVEDERALVYEAGAVIRQERDGGVVLNPPPFAMVEGSGNGDGQVHLPIVQTVSADVQSMGSTTILVRGQSVNREVLNTTVSGGDHINSIAFETPRYGTWANYFGQREYCTSVSTNDATETVTCTVGSSYRPAHLYVSEQAIRIDLIN